MAALSLLHISDLHIKKSGHERWFEQFLAYLKSDSLRAETLWGIAVTGDVVDSPSKQAFQNARHMTDQMLVAAGLVDDAGGADRTRLYLVPGNHDHRRHGVLGRQGPTSEFARVFTWDFKTLRDGMALYGIDSARDSGAGELARGKILPSTLTEMADFFQSANEAEFRIVLVHHHVLPLPADVRERTLKQTMQDESTLLLANAGTLLSASLSAGVDVVLHGHKHDENVSEYIDRNGGNGRRLLIAGTTNAAGGFQVLNVGDDRSVTIDRFRFEGAEYRNDRAPIRVLDRTSAHMARWAEEAAEHGSVEKFETHVRINAAGDLFESSAYRKITQGQIPRREVTISAEVSQAKYGSVQIDEIIDLETLKPLGDIPPPGPAVRKSFPISNTEAGAVHSGLSWKRQSHNTFGVTARDAQFRENKLDEYNRPTETFRRGMSMCVERLVVSFTFPTRPVLIVPDLVNVIASRAVDADRVEFEFDPYESQRAKESLTFVKDSGIALLDLPYPRRMYRYELQWVLPKQAEVVPPELRKRQNSAHGTINRVSPPGPEDREARALVAANALAQLKRDSALLDDGDDSLELALLAIFADSTELRPVAATFGVHSPRWGVQVPYGLGVCGSAIRRGKPQRYQSTHRRNDGALYYDPPPGVDPDTYYLAVPTDLLDAPVLAEVPPDYYRAAIAIHSADPHSSLHRCTEDAELGSLSLDLLKSARRMYIELTNQAQGR